MTQSCSARARNYGWSLGRVGPARRGGGRRPGMPPQHDDSSPGRPSALPPKFRLYLVARVSDFRHRFLDGLLRDLVLLRQVLDFVVLRCLPRSRLLRSGATTPSFGDRHLWRQRRSLKASRALFTRPFAAFTGLDRMTLIDDSPFAVASSNSTQTGQSPARQYGLGSSQGIGKSHVAR